MKTRNENKTVLVKIIDLNNGECFTTKRSSSQEDGIYLKIDKKSGTIITDRIARDPKYIVAVNLQTGQVRRFEYDRLVTPLPAAEVVY